MRTGLVASRWVVSAAAGLVPIFEEIWTLSFLRELIIFKKEILVSPARDYLKFGPWASLGN
jgi:hypothetical protein